MYTVLVTIWKDAVEDFEVQFPCDDVRDIALSLEELGNRIRTGEEPFYSDLVLTEEEKEDLRHAEEVFGSQILS